MAKDKKEGLDAGLLERLGGGEVVPLSEIGMGADDVEEALESAMGAWSPFFRLTVPKDEGVVYMAPSQGNTKGFSFVAKTTHTAKLARSVGAVYPPPMGQPSAAEAEVLGALIGAHVFDLDEITSFGVHNAALIPCSKMAAAVTAGLPELPEFVGPGLKDLFMELADAATSISTPKPSAVGVVKILVPVGEGHLCVSPALCPKGNAAIQAVALGKDGGRRTRLPLALFQAAISKPQNIHPDLRTGAAFLCVPPTADAEAAERALARAAPEKWIAGFYRRYEGREALAERLLRPAGAGAERRLGRMVVSLFMRARERLAGLDCRISARAAASGLAAAIERDERTVVGGAARRKFESAWKGLDKKGEE